MLRRGKYAVLCSTGSMSGEFCRRLRCQITCTFSQRQQAGMRPSAISQNGLSARSTKRIALRITGHLCQREPRRIGDGRKVVFDRLLRSDESLSEKWEYVRLNPVRAGFVEHSEDWPYQFQFNA